MKRKSIIIVLFCIAAITVFVWQHTSVIAPTVEKSIEKPEERPEAEEVKEAVKETEITSIHPTDVPFIVQAPFGEWNDNHFQNGCEEASLVMAKYWYEKENLTKDEAKQEILRMEKFEEKKFGTYVDTSLFDTEKILDEFYGIEDSKLVMDGTKEDIIQELQDGNSLVIIPADGRKLKNPNFTQPGPPRHMLVIIGYDTETKEFITNDPGTRKGKDYRYKEDILMDAILDYPTGNHAEVKSTKKPMLIVERED